MNSLAVGVLSSCRLKKFFTVHILHFLLKCIKLKFEFKTIHSFETKLKLKICGRKRILIFVFGLMTTLINDSEKIIHILFHKNNNINM